MAVTDFLNSGASIPSGSALTATSATTSVAPWYQTYMMDLLAKQNALTNRPYQPSVVPPVAEFSPAQQAGFEQTLGAANSYQPFAAMAGNTLQNAAGMSAAGAAAPMFGQAADISGMAAAQPYMTAAGKNATNVSAYMNPYIGSVVDRIAALGQRNLSENLLPGLTSKYITAGQLGYGGPRAGFNTPSGMLTDTARALRDVSADTLAQQNAALYQGYTQAQNASQADLLRQAQLANTAANAAAAQQQNLANIAAQQGSLAAQDANRQLTAGVNMADLAGLIQKYGLTAGAATSGVGTAEQIQAQKNLDAAIAAEAKQKAYDQQQIDAALATGKGVAAAVPTLTEKYGIEPTATQPPSTASTVIGGLTGLAGVLADAGVFK